MAMVETEPNKNPQPSSSEVSAVQNYFLLSEQSAFGAARFSRGSRPGLFSNCPLLSTPVDSSKSSAQTVEKIHLDVAIRKETLRLIKVPDSKDTYLLDFFFDANVDGTLSIFYLAEEISDASNKTLKFETSYPVFPSQPINLSSIRLISCEIHGAECSRCSHDLARSKRPWRSISSSTWTRASTSPSCKTVK
jgi:hypothetical protein